MKKAMGMFVSLMVVLSMTGVAVAYWSDEIYMKGTVEMGSVTVGWDSVEAFEDGEPGGENVGSINAWLKDDKTLVIEISNVYPEWWGHVEATMKNAGTIPVDLVDIIIDGELPPENEIGIWIDNDWPDYPRLDPGNVATMYADIYVKQDALEGTTYEFSVTLVFNQWGCEE